MSTDGIALRVKRKHIWGRLVFLQICILLLFRNILSISVIILLIIEIKHAHLLPPPRISINIWRLER